MRLYIEEKQKELKELIHKRFNEWMNRGEREGVEGERGGSIDPLKKSYPHGR